MKIIQIATGYTSIPAKTSAATEIVIEHLSNALVELGHSVTVIDIFEKNRAKQKFDIIEIWMPKGLSATDYTHDLGLKHKIKRVVYSLGTWWKLKKIIKKFKPDVIHVHNQYNGFFIPTRYFNTTIPTAYTLHSHIWTRPWDEIKEKIKINYWLERKCFKKFDKIIILNEYAKTNLAQKLDVPVSKMDLLGNGVNISVYKRLDEKEFDRKQFRSKFAKESELILLNVGSFEDRKNQMFLLKSLRKINSIRAAKLLLIGQIVDQGYYQELVQYIKENDLLEKVDFIGEVSPGAEMNKYYNIADIFVFPSKAESFGLVIIEAMSAGLPVLCGDLPSSKFLSKKEGDIIMYNKESEDDFFEKLKKLLIDNRWRSQTAQLGHLTVLKNYDWNVVALKHIEIYESLRI